MGSEGSEAYLNNAVLFTVRSERHGEGKPECADALYFYGKALYFHVIETAGMLGRSAARYGLDSSIIDGECSPFRPAVTTKQSWRR